MASRWSLCRRYLPPPPHTHFPHTHMQGEPHGVQVVALQAVLAARLGDEDGAVLAAVVLEAEHIGAWGWREV